MTQPEQSAARGNDNGTAPHGTVDTLLEQTLGTLFEGCDNPALERALTDFGRAVGSLTALQRNIARAGAITGLEQLGVKGPAKLVDVAMQSGAPASSDDNGGGSVILLNNVELWPEDVDGFAMLEEIMATILRYVAMPTKAAMATALWILFSHVHDAFHVSPLLAISSPEKRCGKTTLLLILQALVHRPLPAASITAAALFRAIEKFRPTLLVDEADTFIRDNDDLRGVLNSGHVRAAAQIIRSVGDDHEPKVFSTWAPKAVALIGKLPDTLQDRSIVIAMRRRAPGEEVHRLRLDRLYGDLEMLRRQIARWAQDNLAALRSSDPDVPSQLNDRAADGWRCLLAIADRIQASVGDLARNAAVVVSGEMTDDDAAPAEHLLGDIRSLFAERHTDRLSSEDIVAVLIAMEHRPWPEWRQGKPLSKRGLARLLGRFGIHPKKLRIGDTTPQGYLRERFADAFARYLPPLQVEQPEQARENAGFDGSLKWNTPPSVPDAKTGETPGKMGDVPDVPVGDPPSIEEGGTGPGLEAPDEAFWNGLAVEGAG